MLNLNLRGLTAVSMAAAISATGCKKEEAKPADAGAAPAAAPTGDDATGAPALGSENLGKARAMVDKMAEALTKMVADVDAAGNDTAKIKEIGEAFKRNVAAMEAEGEALQKALTDDQKKTLEGYGRDKIGPLTRKLMAAMMKTQAAGLGGGPTPTAAPAVSDAPARPRPTKPQFFTARPQSRVPGSGPGQGMVCD